MPYLGKIWGRWETKVPGEELIGYVFWGIYLPYEERIFFITNTYAMKIIFLLLVSLLLGSVSLCAQKGLLPFGAAEYEYKGLTAKKVNLTIGDQTWVSNTLPSGKKVKIALEMPEGFAVDEKDFIYPNIGISIVSIKGDDVEVVGAAKSLFEKGKGYPKVDVKNLYMNLEMSKEDYELGNYVIYVRFYDQRSTREATVSVPFKLVSDKEPLFVSDAISDFTVAQKINVNVIGISASLTGLFRSNKELNTRYIREVTIPKVKDLTSEEFNQGDYRLEIYDDALSIIKEAEELVDIHEVTYTPLKEGDPPTLRCRVAFKADGPNPSQYTVRFRWVSEDGAKRIDAIMR